MALGPSLEEEVGEMFLQFLVELWLLFVNSKTKTRNGGGNPSHRLLACISLALLAWWPHQDNNFIWKLRVFINAA